jgi:DNA polymerase-3 subunit delta
MAKSTAKSSSISALDFLADAAKYAIGGVYAVHGDEFFLKGEVLRAIKRTVLGEDDGEFSLTTFTGREAQLRDVLDALSTTSLFGNGRRLVVVEEADTFVTQYRTELEDYVARPAKGGVLVLDVKSWPGNTRLAKAVAASGLTVACDAPNERQIKTWLVKRAKASHYVQLEAAAADVLLELVPPELGILVQEVAKLSLLVGESKTIDEKLVRDTVGGWRARATWDMIDAAADGHAAEAIAQLGRILASGEKPQGVLPQMASTLRKFATAVELMETAERDRRRVTLRDALSQAGMLPFKLSDAERQLRQIGRGRAKQITGWLLAADLAMKSYNSGDDAARIELERLIVRLSNASASRQQGAKSA